MKELPELLLIDKPTGISSFDCIRILRRKIGKKKMGHAGTLDPLASGLMLIGIERGTKQLTKLIGLDKEYEARILLGASTTTADLEGTITSLTSVFDIQTHAVDRVLSSLVGVNTLPVPLYSAVKIDGRPLYAYTRSGMAVDVPERRMRVYTAERISKVTTEFFWVNDTHISLEEVGDMSFAGAVFSVRLSVASGVYIRSLVEEIGKKLGCPATLLSLRRTRIGDFSVKDALGLDEV